MTARRLALGTLCVSIALCVGAVVFLVRAWRIPMLPSEFGVKGYAIAWSLVIGGVGAVIAVRRPSNPIGWIFCLIGILAGVIAFTTEYARWALIQQGERPPGGLYAAWVQEWAWLALVAGIGSVAAMFPDGRFLSGLWRKAVWASIAATAVPIVLNALIPHLTVFAGFDNPIGIGGPGLVDAAGYSTLLVVPLMFLGAATVVHRLRRAHGAERQQLRWLAVATTLVAAMLVVYACIVLVQGTPSPTGERFTWLEVLTILSFLAVPVSIAFGVLKYRLYDIDIVINKAVVYGGLAAFATGVYLMVVIAVGSLIGYAYNPVLSAIAAAIVALAFQSARHHAQRFANRVVYGKRATPYEVLGQLSDRIAGEYAVDDILDRIAAVLADGLGADAVTVWLLAGTELRPAAVRPVGTHARTLELEGELPRVVDETRLFEVRHRGEVLGAIGVRKPPSDPLSPADEKLVTELAGQAGLVLRNVALLEDVRASRLRLVTAQDHERRRLERNIHDGAQQQLVALAVKLRLADGLVGRDDEGAHDALAELQHDANEALENLRDLARGIYPPLLVDKGLAAALEAQARKSSVPVAVEADGVGRYPPAIEGAVYFCCLEALQNVAKYAGASTAEIRLAVREGELRFEVTDDGVGFDPGATDFGTGLRGMSDRLEALGGDLRVTSAPGRGTAVIGRLPAEGSR